MMELSVYVGYINGLWLTLTTVNGPFKPAPRGFRYVYVTIDKFSKWIKYKPLVPVIGKRQPI